VYWDDLYDGVWIDDWIYFTLHIHTLRDYKQYSATAILHTFQFTVAHIIGFSVFTSRILVTDLSQSHCSIKSHVNSSLQSPIPFLPSLLSHLRPISSNLDPILFRILFCTPCYSASTLRLKTTLHGPHGKRRLLLSRIRVY
jgi:hypothetical protein